MAVSLTTRPNFFHLSSKTLNPSPSKPKTLHQSISSTPKVTFFLSPQEGVCARRDRFFLGWGSAEGRGGICDFVCVCVWW